MTRSVPKTSDQSTTFSNDTHAIPSCSIHREQPTEINPTLNSKAFRFILPYRSLDTDLMFINKKSIGFGLHIVPTADPNDQLVTSIVELIKHQLPADIDCTVMLHKHQHIQTILQRGLQPMLSKGDVYTQLAETHMNAVTETNHNENTLLRLHDYRCYLFLSTHHHLDDKSILTECRNNIELLLNQAHLTHARIEEADFLVLMRSLIAPNLTATEWPAVFDLHHAAYGHIIAPTHAEYSLGNSSIDVASVDQQGTPIQTRIVNCQLQAWPKDNALKKTTDLFTKSCRPELHLSGSFLLSFTLRGRDRIGIHPVFYNLMLLTTPTHESADIKQATEVYLAFDFKLHVVAATQWLCFLASLPFFITEGYYHELNVLGMLKKMTSNQVANIMPIIADRKGSRQGLLLPTHSQQIAFLNTFDNQNHPIINFNYLIAAAPGKHSRVFGYEQIINGLALGEKIVVLDWDQSYKSLCEKVGGQRIVVTTAAFNPFLCLTPTSPHESQLIVCDLPKLPNDSELIIKVLCSTIVHILNHVQKLDPALKKRCIIDDTPRHLTSSNNPILVNFIRQQFQTASQHNTGFGIITHSFAGLMKTQQGQALAAACDIKFILQKSNIEAYANAFPHRIHPIQQRIMASFEDAVNPKYYDILVETGNTQGLHRYFIPPELEQIVS
ncbi:MAG: TraC family protein [Legionellaceae bacterium]|nr:TraC family protein [Legionellaceae bacterium]